MRQPFDRALFDANGTPRDGLHILSRLIGITHPGRIEIERACRDALVALAGIDRAGVAAMQQLEEMVLGLAGPARIPDQRLRQRRILDAVILFTAFAERATVKSDDRGMPA